MSMQNRVTVIDMKVSLFASIDEVISQLKQWIYMRDSERQGRSVCLSNVHMCMKVKDSVHFKRVVNDADMVLPDGKPMSVAQRLLGSSRARQIRGTDLTLLLCELSHAEEITVGFYGGTPDVLEKIKEKLIKQYPNIKIKLMISPPFRALNEQEDIEYLNQINQSDIDILFLGLGCPKQEQWMAEHRDRLKCVMLGVGAAFDFIAGTKKNAPKVVQELGLEWLYRLASEPCRLWRRYLKQNPRFLYHFGKQYLRVKKMTSNSTPLDIEPGKPK